MQITTSYMLNTLNLSRCIHDRRTQTFAVRTLFLTLVTIFLSVSVGVSEDDAPPMWGGLKAGSFQVGFKTVFAFDKTQPSIPYSDWDGKLYPTPEANGRQMQINIWYPAKISERDDCLEYAHYVELMSQLTDFSPIDQEKRRFADEQFIARINALGSNGQFTNEKLKVLKKLKTNAYLDAAPIDKTFPLVIFPNGGSPAFQSIVCEYYASHGFIVIGVALKGQFGSTDDASLRGIEMAVLDLNFAVSKALEIPQVDRERIGLVGNAMTTAHIVAFQNRNPFVRCIVSLEGGLLTGFEQKLLSRTAFYEPQTVNRPIFAAYAPSPSVDPKNISHLKHSDRYFFHFPQMSEFHFLNFGAFEQFVPNVIGEPKGDVQTGFQLACSYSLRFINAYLKDDSKSLQLLEQEPAPSVRAHIDKWFTMKAVPAPPNITLVKDSYLREGFVYIERVYHEHKTRNETPFSIEFFNDMRGWLGWKRDPTYEQRFKLYQLALDSYPNSATINFYAAYFASRTKRRDVASRHFQRASDLLESDTSTSLTVEGKKQISEFVERWFRDLPKQESDG